MQTIKQSFGSTLRFFRRECHDPIRGGILSQERFAELISERIKKPYSRNDIGNWERDKSIINPNKRELLVGIIAVLIQCDGIKKLGDANLLLETGNYRTLNNEEVSEISPDWIPPTHETKPEELEIPTTFSAPEEKNEEGSPKIQTRISSNFKEENETSTLWPATLPTTEPYYSLPDRDTDLEKLMNVIKDPMGRRIIAIDGLGGLGKTSMSVEIGRRCLAEGIFERVVGESAKQERLVGEYLENVPEAPARLTFDGLLDTIARQLNRWDIPTMKPEEKRATLRYLLEKSSYLIIVDNLETADNARNLVMELQSLHNGSRVIVTSRPRLDLDFVASLSLKGLSALDSLVFLQAEARSRISPKIADATEEDLRRIHTVTGGAPLAMKLVVGQASMLPLSMVLENLEKAKGNIYRFIFLASWNLLSVEAQKLLIYMGTVATTCAYEELAGVDIARDDDDLQTAIKDAISLSLLHTNETVRKKRYSIHSLTRHFVNSDLPNIWKEQGLI